ncbi:hypothetical protein GJAV_G00195430 [Gymnothorax javanicus]|nr:hypothetical protein GJAV_G00195430 [Gymnothorax javanicus]
MDDVILISSGTDDDSDVEIVSVYNDARDESSEEITEWISFPSPCIDLTDSRWEPLERRYQRRRDTSPLVSVALSDKRQTGSGIKTLNPSQKLATEEAGRSPGITGDLSGQNLKSCLHSWSPELKEEEKPLDLDCFGCDTWNFPLKSHPNSPSKSPVKEEKIPGSLLSHILDPAYVPHTPKIEQEAPESPLSSVLEPDWTIKSPLSSNPDPDWTPRTPDIEQETPVSLLSSVPEPDWKPNSPPPCNSESDWNAQTEHRSAFAAAPSPLECKTDNALRHTGTASTQHGLGETEEAEGWGDGISEYIEAALPLSPFSPYYCPSEIDCRLYSDSSSSQDCEEQRSPPPSSPVPSQFIIEGLHQRDSAHSSTSPHRLSEAEVLIDRQPGSPPPAPHSPMHLPRSQGPDHGLTPLRFSPPDRLSARSVSPTSTQILAGDSPDWLREDAELSNGSPASLLSSDSGDSEGEELADVGAGSGSRQANRKDRRYVSRTQLSRLKHLMGRSLQDRRGDGQTGSVGGGRDENEEEEDEDLAPAEPICRQGLSLVHSSMEERCHDSMLQLLSDFLPPHRYPPADVMSHLIRGVLLEHESSPAVAAQAYSLLMRIQRNHPATESTVQWDWDLLASVMDERGTERRPVLSLFLRYVLQTLQDDFHFSLPRLQGSIAKAMLSCNRNMPHVRDVINWLVAAVTSSTDDPTGTCDETEKEKQRDRDENLKVVLMLQKMLALAVEVDGSPVTSSNKISEDLHHILIGPTLPRPHRQLLLQTLDSTLLRCKLVELHLQHVCTEKTELPMSLRLILHFMRYATLAPEPKDGAEAWHRWRELLQLLWMLLLSYEEVVDGHLRRPINQRASYSLAPVWTENDDITEVEIQEAAECFQWRASADIGPAPPPQVLELLSYLQDHLHCFCRHDL